MILKLEKKTHKNICIKKIRKLDQTEKILNEMKKLIETGSSSDEKAMQDKFQQMIKIHGNKKIKKNKLKEKKDKRENIKKFRQLLYSTNTMSDLKYFRTLTPIIQKKIIQQMTEINNHTKQSKPYRMTLLETKMDTKYKVSAINKINTLNANGPSSRGIL